MKKILISLLALFSIAVQAQTFPVNNLTAAGYITSVGNITTSGGQFIGAGTGLTGTAAGLSIGGNAVNIAGGLAGQLHCQTAANTTGFVAGGVNGYFLQYQTGSCPIWVAGSTYTPGSVAITGGSINGTTIGATTPSIGVFTKNTVGSGSNGLLIEPYVGGVGGAIYNASLTPSNSNFAFNASSSSTYLNAVSGIQFQIGGTQIASVGSGGLAMNSQPFYPATVQGIGGTTLADNAQSGSVGEFYTTGVAGPVSLTNGSAINIQTGLLPAGDWNVWGVIGFNGSGTTSVTYAAAGSSTISGAVPGFGSRWLFQYGAGFANGDIWENQIPIVRYNVSSSTPIYCVAQTNFTVSTLTATCILNARRIR